MKVGEAEMLDVPAFIIYENSSTTTLILSYIPWADTLG